MKYFSSFAKTVMLCTAITSVASESRPVSHQLPVLPGLWNNVLWKASNFSGYMDRDLVLEAKKLMTNA